MHKWSLDPTCFPTVQISNCYNYLVYIKKYARFNLFYGLITTIRLTYVIKTQMAIIWIFHLDYNCLSSWQIAGEFQSCRNFMAHKKTIPPGKDLKIHKYHISELIVSSDTASWRQEKKIRKKSQKCKRANLKN